MRNYLFKNLNILFLTCALAFISIANAQEFVHIVSNKGTKAKVFIPTIAEVHDNFGGFDITNALERFQIYFRNLSTDFYDENNNVLLEHYESSFGAIIVKKAGTYKVSYRVSAQLTSGGSASGTEYDLYNTGTKVDGTYSAAYHEGTNSKDTASASRILVLLAGALLEVRGRRYAGFSAVSTVKHGSSLLVECIKLTSP